MIKGRLKSVRDKEELEIAANAIVAITKRVISHGWMDGWEELTINVNPKIVDSPPLFASYIHLTQSNHIFAHGPPL